MKKLQFLVLAAAAACAPAVTHSPRVEPGPTFHVTAGTPRPLCDTGCSAEMIPTLGGGFRYGWVPEDPRKPSVMLGATVPIFDPVTPEVDTYLQAPSTGTWVAGVGTLWSPRHIVPYVQVGPVAKGRGGWYLTGGYSWLLRDPNTFAWIDQESSGSRMARPPRFWSPGFGYRTVVEGRRFNVFVNGALGSWVERQITFRPPPGNPGPTPEPVTDTVNVDRRVRSLFAGMSLEVPIGDPPVRARPLPPVLPAPPPEQR